jgi:hypothetical protein
MNSRPIPAAFGGPRGPRGAAGPGVRPVPSSTNSTAAGPPPVHRRRASSVRSARRGHGPVPRHVVQDQQRALGRHSAGDAKAARRPRRRRTGGCGQGPELRAGSRAELDRRRLFLAALDAPQQDDRRGDIDRRIGAETMPNIMGDREAEQRRPPNRPGPPAPARREPVMIVRDRVSLIDRSITSRSGIFLYLRRFSRRRSNTTTVSFIE